MHRAQRHAVERALARIRSDVDGKARGAPTSEYPPYAVLDFGCGAGRWTETLAALGCEYAGVDISEEMLRIASGLHPNHTFAPIRNRRIPHPTGRFDAVFSLAVLHHNPVPDQERLLDEIDRVLRPGGHLFLFEAIGERTSPRVFPRSTGDWIGAVQARGFQCLDRRRYDYYVITDLVRRVAWKLRLPWLGGARRPAGLMRVDGIVSPRLSRWISFGRDVRGAMLFRKES